eukprot:jgi/Psemu1/40560/gm1.40560_g
MSLLSAPLPPPDVLMKLKKFLTAFQDGSKDPTKNLQGTLTDEYSLKKDTYLNTSEALDMLLRFTTVKNSNQKQSDGNPNNNNNSKGTARGEGNSRQGSEKTYEGTAFVTNGEGSKGTVQEVHQLIINGIAEGETFGNEKLYFMQICNMEVVSQNSFDDNGSPSDGEVPMLVARQRTSWDSDSEDSTNCYDSDNSEDEWFSDEESSTGEKPRSENYRSEKPRSGSAKPRSGNGGSESKDIISPGTEFLLTQNHGKLDPNLLLLDSQASCNVISNKALLCNIRLHPGNGRIVIHYNAGSVATTMVGGFPGFGMVWYLEKGIANILSLGLVSDKYRVTLDTSLSQSFFVHKDDGTTCRFNRASNNLYTCNLTDQDETIFAITTEEGKKEFYSNTNSKRAEVARRLQEIMGFPSTKELLYMIDNNRIQNCNNTRKDVKFLLKVAVELTLSKGGED